METQKEPKQKKESNDVKSGIVGCLIIVLLIIVFFWAKNAGKEDKVEKVKDYKIEAYVCAQMEVEKMLKAPGTAEFEFGGSMNSTKDLGNGNFEINSYVDAENSFGAKLRQNFKCKVNYDPNGKTCETECDFL